MKFEVVPASGEKKIIEADEVDLDASQNRVTFKTGADVVASFVGAQSFHKVE